MSRSSARTSSAAAATGEKRNYAESSDTEEEGKGELDHVSSNKGPNKRKAIAASKGTEGEEDEKDEEENEKTAETGASSSSTFVDPEIAAFECGQILEIHMENFMCHRKFTIKLDKHLNFINGINGSGKSAIAAALQLCLGGASKSTGRGKNQSSYVREGSGANAMALIRLKLRNEGSDAYQPEVYGSVIVVERRIMMQGGGGGYRLYSTLNGGQKEVSREKRVLLNILRAFNIYVDNPCCVLTQEETKKFVNGTSNAKYKFFLKASGLAGTYEDLEESREVLESVEAEKDRKKDRLKDLKATMESTKKDLETLLSFDKIEEMIRDCAAKMLWIEILEKERDQRVEEEELQERRDLLESERATFVSLSSNDGSKQVEHDEKLKETEVLQEQVDSHISVIEEKQREVTDAQRQVNISKQEITRKKGHIEDHVRRLKNAEKELEQKRKKAHDDAQVGERSILEGIEKCSESLHRLEQQERDLSAERANLQQELGGRRAEEQRLMGDINSNRRQIDTLRNEMANLKQGGTNSRFSVFGYNLPKAMEEINRTKFNGPIVGPLGSCIQVKEGFEQHKVAIERAIGWSCNNFVVSNGQDQRTLTKIFNKYNYKGSVITRPSKPRYNVQQIPNALTVVDTLVFESDAVFNALIDDAGIETKVIVETVDQMHERFVRRSNRGVDEFLPGIRQCILRNEGHFLIYKNGNMSYETNRDNKRNYLTKDSTEALKEKDEAINELVAKDSDLQRVRGELTNAMQQLNQRITDISNEMKRCSTESRRHQHEKQTLDNQLQEVQASTNTDFGALEAEIEELKAAIEAGKTALENLEELLRNATRLHKERQGEKKAMEEENLLKIQDIERLTNRVTELHQQMKHAKRMADAMEKKIQQLEREVVSLEKALDKVRAATDKYVVERKALIAECIENWNGEPLKLTRKETAANLKKLKITKEAELAEAKRTAGLSGRSVEQLQTLYERQKAEFETEYVLFKKHLQNVKDLKTDIEERHERWYKTLKINSKSVKDKFDFYMQKRGSAGTIKFDHDEQTLTIKCQTDSHDTNTQISDAKNLSGGERSYVTFALLLALGHVIECPFRLMDEYDVFLDENMRKKTLDQLMAYTKRADQKHRQFLILTPHSLSSIHTIPGQVRIHRMPDPDRRASHGLQQQTLAFGAGV